MKKVLIALGVVVTLGVAGIVIYVMSNLDRLVADAIAYCGSRATGTEVAVSGVDLSIREGRLTIDGLSVANPEGFEYPNAFTLSSITIDIDPGSAGSELIMIDLINVSSPEIFFELEDDGKNNLQAIQRNLRSTSASGGTEPSGDQPAPRLSIDRIELAEAALHARIEALNETRDLTMAPIALNDLEGRPMEIARQVADRLLDAALGKVREEGVDRLRDRAREKLEGELEGLEDKAVDKLGEALGR